SPCAADRLLPGLAVERLAQQVGVTVVPRVLLDHVGEDPAQARCLTVGKGASGELIKTVLLQRLGDMEAGPLNRCLPQVAQLLGGVVSCRVPVPIGICLPVDAVPGGMVLG